MLERSLLSFVVFAHLYPVYLSSKLERFSPCLDTYMTEKKLKMDVSIIEVTIPHLFLIVQRNLKVIVLI